MGNPEQECPYHPFRLHIAGSFETDSYKWEAKSNTMENIKGLSPLIAARLNNMFEDKQLKATVEAAKPFNFTLPNITEIVPTKWIQIETNNNSIILKGKINNYRKEISNSTIGEFDISFTRTGNWFGELLDNIAIPFKYIWTGKN